MPLRTMATWQNRKSRWPRDRVPRSGRPYWQRAVATFNAAEALRARPASHVCIPSDGSTVSHHTTVLSPYPLSTERPSPGAQQVPSGLEWSGDCFRVIPNRFPALNSANQPETMNASKSLIYNNLAALSVVAGVGFEPTTFRL